jgi:hypothetical protein
LDRVATGGPVVEEVPAVDEVTGLVEVTLVDVPPDVVEVSVDDGADPTEVDGEPSSTRRGTSSVVGESAAARVGTAGSTTPPATLLTAANTMPVAATAATTHTSTKLTLRYMTTACQTHGVLR